jgi:hypothetical protein
LQSFYVDVAHSLCTYNHYGSEQISIELFVGSCVKLYRTKNLYGVTMIRWKSPNKAGVTRRWRSREEIVRSHLDQLSSDELLRVRPDYWSVRFGSVGARRNDTKYASDQPRVPAGNPDGGQWTSDGAGFLAKPATYRLAANGKQSAAYCWNQMQIDMLYCSTRPAPIGAACRAQAMERYAACLRRKPLPPLPF